MNLSGLSDLWRGMDVKKARRIAEWLLFILVVIGAVTVGHWIWIFFAWLFSGAT